MKISPIGAYGTNDTGTPNATRIQPTRSIKIATNMNPGAYEDIPPPPAPQERTILDNNEQVDAKTDADTQPLSPQFAALAKQRRVLQEKEKALADREKALSTTGQNSIEIARLKSEPLRVLLEAGVTYEQLVQEIQKSPINPELHSLEQKVNSLEEGFEKKLSDRDAQAEKQVLAQMHNEALQIVAQGDDFELVRGTRSTQDAIDLIERTYREDGTVLDVREALQLIEDELFKEAGKLTSFKKVQSRFAPQASPPQQRQQGMRTLTNRDTAAPPMTSRQRALAAFKGTLQQ